MGQEQNVRQWKQPKLLHLHSVANLMPKSGVSPKSVGRNPEGRDHASKLPKNLGSCAAGAMGKKALNLSSAACQVES